MTLPWEETRPRLPVSGKQRRAKKTKELVERNARRRLRFQFFFNSAHPFSLPFPITNSSLRPLVCRPAAAQQQETDPRRLEQRQKQIDFGKNTRGYQRYSAAVPRYNEERRRHCSMERRNDGGDDDARGSLFRFSEPFSFASELENTSFRGRQSSCFSRRGEGAVSRAIRARKRGGKSRTVPACFSIFRRLFFFFSLLDRLRLALSLSLFHLFSTPNYHSDKRRFLHGGLVPIDPMTPDVRQACSKRAFDGQVRKWRRMLHEWDPEGERSRRPKEERRRRRPPLPGPAKAGAAPPRRRPGAPRLSRSKRNASLASRTPASAVHPRKQRARGGAGVGKGGEAENAQERKGPPGLGSSPTPSSSPPTRPLLVEGFLFLREREKERERERERVI